MKKAPILFLAVALSLGVLPLRAQVEFAVELERPAKVNRFEVSKQLEILNALVKEVQLFYVDSVETEKMVRRGIDAMLKGLDPYTEYYPEQETENVKMLVTGEYGGIGAFIRARDGGVIISEPFEGMPAALAGLKAGDRILMIDTADVTKATTQRVSELLKGVPNSKVTLKIERRGEKKPMKVEIVRKQVAVKQVVHYGVYGNGTGYIYLEGFREKSADEVREAFEDLKKNHHITSLVLDLRDNGGGLLSSAVQIVNLFVPKGREVLSTRSRMKFWDRTYRTTLDPVDSVIPMAVIINGSSASASEIVSGALQDMDRAVLIGNRSFGKGLVQTPRDLPYDGQVKITTSKYYIPSGRCIQQLDYSHRNADGSVSAVPDSLTSVFYTANGRPVRDGGGIRPDFEMEEKKTPTILFYLINDFTLFDYVTDWVREHPTIAPAKEFVFSDADYEVFKKRLKDAGFTYDRQSEKALKALKETAEFEGYLAEDSAVFVALEARLKPDLDRDLERYKDEIKRLISTEIAKRYYFQEGGMIETLKDDKTLKKALEVLADKELYKKTLSRPEEEEKK
ncbi:S41 family peptidase [uncultured Porphyromonas sp.]|uniref:S41 family peptidase n=1 Tax=uncultured Porphyromonas sp. TaxID=159274 RepID=UPI0026303DAA|nr:S41 family peptidase [uncultured Porphyromonas sp.]